MQTDKTCSRCKILKPASSFNREGEGLRSWCRECNIKYLQELKAKDPEKYRQQRREAQRRYYAKNAEKSKAKHILRNYGLTLEEYNEIMSRNEGMCVICNEKPATHLDHCHKTLKWRGGLCSNCNTGLGQFQDRIDLLEAAIRYLSETK